MVLIDIPLAAIRSTRWRLEAPDVWTTLWEHMAHAKMRNRWRSHRRVEAPANSIEAPILINILAWLSDQALLGVLKTFNGNIGFGVWGGPGGPFSTTIWKMVNAISSVHIFLSIFHWQMIKIDYPKTRKVCIPTICDVSRVTNKRWSEKLRVVFYSA